MSCHDQLFITSPWNHAVDILRGQALPGAAAQVDTSAQRLHSGSRWLRWEGDTLVVTTTQFHPQQSLRTAIKHQLYVGLNSIVTERFTRIAENEMVYEFTVEDDDIYRRPWRGELSFNSSDEQIYEYACHEGSYGMPGMLTGERKQGVNGIRWIYGLITQLPEEVIHQQLSNSRVNN